MRSIKNILTWINAKQLTVNNPRQSDTYIVEFPKSGITWLSTILANAALIRSNREEVANFTNVLMFVPDVHISRDCGDSVYSYPPCRLIKSHSKWNKNYKFIIYLVRNPLSVMKSYYHFLYQIGKLPFRNFDSFCRSKKFGVKAWKNHVNSWLTGYTVPNRLHLIRYEDLLTDTIGEIRMLSHNFGWNFNDSIIERAIDRSTIEKMQASESLYKKKNPRYNMTFIKAKNIITIEEKTVEYIYMICGELCNKLGYEAIR